MLTLNIRLSSFRLTANSPAALPKAAAQLRLCTTTHKLRAYDSPKAQLPPPSPSSVNANGPVDLVFPPSFTVAWTETLPDRLALRAAMLTVAVRVAHKPRFSASLCAPAPPMRTAADLSVPLRDLAVSTVTQSLRLNEPRGTPSALVLSFAAVVDCPSQVRLSLADLRLAAKASPVGERFPLTLTLTHALSGAYSTTTIPSLHPHALPASRISSDSNSSAVTPPRSKHARPSPPSPSPPHDDSDAISTDVHSASHSSPTNSNTDVTSACAWSTDRISDMLLQAPNLHDLAHSNLVVALAAAPEPGAPPSALGNMLLSASLPLYDVWAALMHPSVPYRHTVALSSSVSLTLSLCADTCLPPGQMVGGVTTDLSITGAKSLTFGSELLLDRLPADPAVPPAWARVVDSFGTPYFHHRSSAVAVWTMPHDDAVEPAVRADELRAEHRGFDRFKRGIFVHRASGAQCWRHPDALPNGQTAPQLPVLDDLHQRRQQQELASRRHAAVKASHVSGSATADGEASPRTSFSLSTVDCADVHPASLARRHDDMRGPDSGDGGGGARPPVVEMHWKMLGREGYAPREGTEGHTLTSVLGGHKMIKFGGAGGSRRSRTNHIDVFDVDALEWSEQRVNGVRPPARTGHAAVALGSEQDRLLVFGGSSAQGRLNDVNVYHVLNSTWSPVSVSGPVPAARARSGMTVTQDGGTALLFGGRSIYRYLGGKYFDPLFVNAFHAERGLWEQIRPRGSGPRPAPRSGCVVELINGRHMLVHGGYDDGDRFFDDTFIFDLPSCSWQKLGPFPGEKCPPARESHASTVVDGDVVICGGTGDELFLSDVQVFDAGRMRWGARPRTVGVGPGKIGGGSMATTHDGRAIFVGGEDGWALSRRTFVLEVSHRSAVPVDALIGAVRERGPDAGRCVVCMDAPVTTMFVWCGHSVCCTACAPLVRNICPVCRKPFSRIERIGPDSGGDADSDEAKDA